MYCLANSERNVKVVYLHKDKAIKLPCLHAYVHSNLAYQRLHLYDSLMEKEMPTEYDIHAMQTKHTNRLANRQTDRQTVGKKRYFLMSHQLLFGGRQKLTT